MSALAPRHADWQARLDTLVREWLALPAAALADDDAPARWLAAAIEAVTGTVLPGDAAALEQALGEPTVPRLCLAAGDLGAQDDADGRLVAVVLGREALAVTPIGLMPLPLDRLTAGWRLG